MGKRKSAWGAVDKDEILRLSAAGCSDQEVADAVCCCRQYVARIRCQAGAGVGRGNYSGALDARSVCPACHREFVKTRKNQLYCSAKCERHDAWARHDDVRRLAEKRASNGQNITLLDVAERDGGICYLCGREVDWSDWTRDEHGHFIAGADYPTRDHVVPLAAGGAHSWENIRLAHFGCNSAKRDLPLVEFERSGRHA